MQRRSQCNGRQGLRGRQAYGPVGSVIEWGLIYKGMSDFQCYQVHCQVWVRWVRVSITLQITEDCPVLRTDTARESLMESMFQEEVEVGAKNSHQSRSFFPSHSVQFSLVTQSHPTLCGPVDHSTPGLPVHHQLQSPPKPVSIESVMPSNHLIPCCPLLLPPSIFPIIRVFSNESVLCIS